MMFFRKVTFITKHIRRKMHLICTYVLIILSVSLAILASNSQHVCGSPIFSDYFNCKREQSDILKYCLSNYESSSLTFWLILLLSFSPVGLFVPWIIIAVKTYGISLILCNLYIYYHIKGIVFGILIILPGSFLSLYSLLYFLQNAMKTSILFCKIFRQQSIECHLSTHMKEYLINVLKSALILFSSLIIDFILSELFMAYKLFFS